MSRSVASPAADTPSYWPLFISVTISSDDPATLLLTLQPVCCVNGVTQSGSPFLLPSITYPAHETRSTSPSPAPTDCAVATLGGAAWVAPPAPPVPDDAELDEPQPASAVAAAAASSAARTGAVLLAVRIGSSS